MQEAHAAQLGRSEEARAAASAGLEADPDFVVTDLDGGEQYHISELEEQLTARTPYSTFDNFTPFKSPRIYVKVTHVEERDDESAGGGLLATKYAAYAIDCVCVADSNRWTIWRRFSDFHALHAAIKLTAYGKYISEAPVPKKALFTSTKPKSALVEQRKTELQAFLDACLLPIDLSDCAPLAKFLDVDRNVQRRRVRHVLLVRHGQYKSARDDLERTLSAAGRRQAELTGMRIQSIVRSDPSLSPRVFYSTMTRAAQTAAIVRAFVPGLPAQADDLLREGPSSFLYFALFFCLLIYSFVCYSSRLAVRRSPVRPGPRRGVLSCLAECRRPRPAEARARLCEVRRDACAERGRRRGRRRRRRGERRRWRGLGGYQGGRRGRSGGRRLHGHHRGAWEYHPLLGVQGPRAPRRVVAAVLRVQLQLDLARGAPRRSDDAADARGRRAPAS